MAIAMVSTPDVAKDLFKGLWDQNTEQELYQAYQNLQTARPASLAQLQSLQSSGPAVSLTTLQPPSYVSRTSAGYEASSTPPPKAAYLPVSSSNFSPPTSSYSSPAAFSSPAPSSTTYPASPAASSSHARSPPYTRSPPYPAPTSAAYIPCRTPPSYTSYSPGPSCGSSSCSEKDAASGAAGVAAPVSTSHYTKLALILIAQNDKKKLSHEEEEKRRIRRERNKIAATKCRQKRRAHSNNVDSEYTQVVDVTKKLEEEIGALQREKAELQQLLQTHYCQRQPSFPTTRHLETPTRQPFLETHHTQPASYMETNPPTTFAELFVKEEPNTPSLKKEIDPFN